jgi:sialidase-1
MRDQIRILTVAEHDSAYTRKSEGDVVELNNGNLLLSYMEFRGDGSDFASTRLVIVESMDGGRTWGHHRVITETAPGDINVYSPNLIRLSAGEILYVFARYHEGKPRLATHHVWRSLDEGQTFSPYSLFGENAPLGSCNATLKRLSSGRLLFPMCGMIPDNTDNPYGGTYDGVVYHSDDGGKRWIESKNRLFLPMRGVMENHVEETRDGRVIQVMRNQLGSLFLSYSSDGGETWTKPQTSGLSTPESCPELVRIPATGDLLMIWNNSPYDPGASHSGKRNPLTAAVSTDEGRTWGFIRDIETDPTRAFSNPGCRFTREGRAILNYWTCEYLPNGHLQDIIDLRVAQIETDWFYGR